MRCLFAHVNGDSSRTLTAENSSFYTTFDEILQETHRRQNVDEVYSLNMSTNLEELRATNLPSVCPNMNNSDVPKNRSEKGDQCVNDSDVPKNESENGFVCVNMVPSVIGRKLNEALHDILNFVQGPRVRDRISHGEVLLHQIPQDIVHHIVCLSLLLLTLGNWRKESEISKEVELVTNSDDDTSKLSGVHISDTKCTVPYIFLLPLKTTGLSTVAETTVKSMKDSILGYRCAYHPSAVLLKSLASSLVELEKWTDWDRVSSKDLDYPDWETTTSVELPAYLEYSTLTCHKYDVISINEIGLFRHNIDVDCNVLYRGKLEIEYVSVFTRIVSCIQSFLENIHDSLTVKYSQYMNKSLRSRQRETYRRQLSAIPTLVISCYFTCQVTYMLFVSFNTRQFSEPINLMKILKKVLKLQENIVSQTNINANRWDEALRNSVDNIETLKKEFTST